MFEAHMNFGQLTLSYRGYQDASQAFSRAHELQPQNYDALLGLGAALRGLAQLDDAERRYREAIALDARRPEAYYNLGLLYQDYMGGQETQLNQAVAFYNQFVERAANERYTETRENVTRTCRRRPQTQRRRRRGSGRDRPVSEWVGTCTPGRIQQIQENLRLQRELAEIQSQIQAQQQQIEQQQQPEPEPAPAPEGQ
jgi:tetratricopeptide (TPR) repeat protein